MTANSQSYFERIDDTHFRPTPHTGGGWDPTELHFSPLGGLMAHLIERHAAENNAAGLLVSRLSFDILGRLANDVCEVRVETTRPGRTIELIEATLLIQDRASIRARAWMLARIDTSEVAGGGDPALPDPHGLAGVNFGDLWPGGFVKSLEMRAVTQGERGRGAAWLSTTTDLIAGEEVSDFASYIALVDTANGVAGRESTEEWMFPNVDLTIHLHRQPAGRWVELDTTVVFGASGQGVTSTVLHDLSGPVGFAEQLLTVRPRPR